MDFNLTNVTKKELLHKGKANNVYATSDPQILELEASDRISAGNGAKTDVITGKGVANNKISMALFSQFEEAGVKTHYLGPGSNECSKFVIKTEPILLECILRNFATGSFLKRFPETPDMMPFDPPFIEFTEKDDSRNDPPIAEKDILKRGILTEGELGQIEEDMLTINDVATKFFMKCNGKLIDFKVEFGRVNGEVILIDEFSPDTCRILDNDTMESLDKDRFRKDMGGVAETYAEMLRRVEKATN